jgi:uncharacterized NAD(P)/FAD-binding protein YdhS
MILVGNNRAGQNILSFSVLNFNFNDTIILFSINYYLQIKIYGYNVMFAHNKLHTSNRENAIGILGFGLSGVTLFCHLVEKMISTPNNGSNQTYKIYIFEKTAASFAAGLPYKNNCPDIWTLNNPAKNLKLTPNGIDMAVWMDENKAKWQDQFPQIDQEYVPRALVGLYLKDQYQFYKLQAEKHGIEVVEHISEIIDVSCDQEQCWQLTSKNADKYKLNSLFLCFGYVTNNHAHLQEKPRYFNCSRDGVDHLKSIPADAIVHVIGGQATFVDIALWLAYMNQHKGKIVTLTRNAPIITTKGNKDTCDKKPVDELTATLRDSYAQNSLTFSECKHLLWQAYNRSTKYPVNITQPPSTKSALNYQMDKYKGIPVDHTRIGNIDELRSFIFTVYFSGCYQELWSKLKEEDKELFTQQLYSHIFAYLTGITPINARLLLELYNREQINEQAGLSKVTYDDQKQKFVIHYHDKETHEADYLIDASGFGYDPSKGCENFPLLKCLIKKGYLTPKTHGGILLNEYSQMFNQDGTLQKSLFCFGPLASYDHQFPTPYASFIANKTIEKSLTEFMLQLAEKNHQKKFG